MTTSTTKRSITPDMQDAILTAQQCLASAEIVAPHMVEHWERELSVALTVAYNYSNCN